MGHREGQWRWIEATGRDLTDDPTVRAVLINLHDITDWKAAADALAVGTRWFDALLAQNADLVTVVDAEGNIALRRPATEPLLGYTPATFAATNTFAYIHPADLPQARELFATILPVPGERAHAEYRMRHRDGTYRWIEATAINMLKTQPSLAWLAPCMTSPNASVPRRDSSFSARRPRLAATHGDEDALAATAAAAVPCLATGCAVELRGPRWQIAPRLYRDAKGWWLWRRRPLCHDCHRRLCRARARHRTGGAFRAACPLPRIA